MAALIAAQWAGHGNPAAVACRALGVSPSWFYKHQGGMLPPRAARRERLKAEVRRLFAVCVPTISSTSRDQAIFVDRATGVSLPSYAVLPEDDRLW